VTAVRGAGKLGGAARRWRSSPAACAAAGTVRGPSAARTGAGAGTCRDCSKFPAAGFANVIWRWC